MDWFYALNKQQQGPVDSATLRALFQGGTINAETLVWHAGLDGWKPYTEIATSLEAAAPTPAPAAPVPEGNLPDFMTASQEPAAAAAVPAVAAAAVPAAISPQDMATCAHSGRVAPKKDMLQYGEYWLMPENKDAFIAALQQGTAVMPGDVRTNMISVGFWWRALAFIIDYFIVMIGYFVCYIPLFLLGGMSTVLSSFNPATDPEQLASGITGGIIIGYILSMILSFAFAGFYYIYLVGKNGGTPGKRLLKFQIVNSDGSKIGYGKATGRFFAMWGMVMAGYIVGAIIMGIMGAIFATAGEEAAGIGIAIGMIFMIAGAGITFFWASWDKYKRALHDLVASTRVIRD